MPLYEKFDILADAERAHNYLTSMVDRKLDSLPYWLIGANENPAWARHCRVDDSELVASWYEGLAGVMEMLGTEDGSEVLGGFKTHLMRSWGEHGLRFHERYPWTHTLHSSFHEMAYILGALVRWRTLEPDNEEVKARLAGLVRGMRGLVIELKTRTFWAGDSPFEERVYKFPNDVYIQDRGWDHSCVTGRGEESIRNGMILHPLVQAYRLFGDEAALDLAIGTANYLLGISRYFNYKREFFGHVHSAVWVAGGLVLLGRLTGETRYLTRGKQIYDYVLGLSSSFGWVPEYAQCHPMSEEHCETCCIKDMIWTGLELVDAGHGEYWHVINLFTRNQLSEQQVKTGAFVGVDNGIPDSEDTTFRDIDKRVVGGYSGGTLPNSISLSRFRAIAGCCVGTAPQALHVVWRNIVREAGGRLEVNLPIDKDDPRAKVETGYPNEGWLQVTVRRDGDLAVRVHPFMDRDLALAVGGGKRPVEIEDGCVVVRGARNGETIRLEHDIRDEVRKEVVAGAEYEVTWRGPDVVGISPEGEPLRLYQREAGRPKEIPAPPPRKEGGPGGFDVRPTEQKK